MRGGSAAHLRRVLIVLSALMALAAPLPPDVVERWYTNGLYAAMQPRLTRATNLVPFAWLDLLILAAVLAFLVVIVAAWRRRTRPAARRAFGALAALVEGAAAVYLVFLLVWGLNYRRVPATERFAVDAGRLTAVHLRALVDQAVEQVNATHALADRDGRLDSSSLLRSLQPAFHAAQRRIGTGWRAAPGRPKASIVARAFPLASVDGMLNPFGLEVVLNPDVLPFERPFVLAHEWAHLAGHADESEASFLAWLTCLEGDRAAQYSGWLAVLLHASRGLPADQRPTALDALGPGPRADIRALQQRFLESDPFVRRISWQLYDRYLRANRVDSGLANYDEVIRLVLGARAALPLLHGPPEL